jgi:hypothetical protein
MNETKMLSFEEWEEYTDRAHMSGYLRAIFDKARQGTIPVDRAVEIPEVWPEWATEIEVTFRGPDEKVFSHMAPGAIRVETINRIPRPQPLWTPRVGEAVFVQWDGLTHVTRVKKAYDGKIDFMLSDGMTHSIYAHQAKPFSESAIGKEWSQI